MVPFEVPDFILSVRFFATEAGSEPVRDWLKSLSKQCRKDLGEDIKTVQYGWPLVKKMDRGLWEVRTHIRDGIARVIFTVQGATMILLHGFVKKSARTPIDDLRTAKRRMCLLNSEQKG